MSRVLSFSPFFMHVKISENKVFPSRYFLVAPRNKTACNHRIHHISPPRTYPCPSDPARNQADIYDIPEHGRPSTIYNLVITAPPSTSLYSCINSDDFRQRFITVNQVFSYRKSLLFPKHIACIISIKHYQSHLVNFKFDHCLFYMLY